MLAHVIGELGRISEIASASCLLVQGDTASSLAGALVSELMGIPLVHVEAGVRSRLRDDPFPEETIRRRISQSELHLCFSEATRENLLAEGIQDDVIAVVPHPMRDRVALLASIEAANVSPEVLLTLHRRERRVQRSERLLELVNWLTRTHPNAVVSFVWHPSLDGDLPQFAARLEAVGANVIPSLPPDEFLAKLARAALVVTDSAGVAEEAQLLGRPLVAFRASAEARLDESPTAPTCATESVAVAIDFVRNLHDLTTWPEGTATPGVVSAGRVIGGPSRRLLVAARRLPRPRGSPLRRTQARRDGVAMIAVDVGASRIRAGEPRSEVPDYDVPTARSSCALLDGIAELVTLVANGREDYSVGVACPGLINAHGVVTRALYLPLEGVDLRRELVERLEIGKYRS